MSGDPGESCPAVGMGHCNIMTPSHPSFQPKVAVVGSTGSTGGSGAASVEGSYSQD